MRAPKPKHKGISYSKYGYRFILPFFLVYLVFSLWPLLSTFITACLNTPPVIW